MSRLFLVNRYFYPDHSPTSTLLSDLAFDLAADQEVYVITSQQIYSDSKLRLPATELIHGVRVIRVPTTQFGRTKLLGRTFDYLSFYVSASRALRRLTKQGDTIIAMTDPPLFSVVASRAAKVRSARLVNWVQDLYPEIAVEVGIPFIRGPLRHALAYLRDQSLRRAAANIVVGERMAEKVISSRVSPERVHVIHNWTDDQQIRPLVSVENPVRREWGLVDKFVVGYSGNLGRAHEYETILLAAERLRSYKNIIFLFIGGGHRMNELAKLVKARGLSEMFRFYPYQDRAKLKHSLTVPDLHWLSLKPALEGMIVPSKFYSILAAGRPSLAIMAYDGEIARMITKYNCGVVIQPGHAQELAETILRLSNDPHSLAAMGQSARLAMDSHFTRQKALSSWRDILSRHSLATAAEKV